MELQNKEINLHDDNTDVFFSMNSRGKKLTDGDTQHQMKKNQNKTVNL
jgi:hypothetical protein